MSDPTTEPPIVPDLRALLAEASRPEASVTVPLKQGLHAAHEAAEAELVAVAEAATAKRMGAKSPLRAAAEKVRAIEDEMRASSLTFTFQALASGPLDAVRQNMAGRDDPDERSLRVMAAMCTRVTDASGHVWSDALSWTDLRDLRDGIGALIFEATISAAAARASGDDWSVPFSSSASHILEMR